MSRACHLLIKHPRLDNYLHCPLRLCVPHPYVSRELTYILNILHRLLLSVGLRPHLKLSNKYTNLTNTS